MADISNFDDIIDSRDIIERIEELDSERQPFVDAIEEAMEAFRKAVDALAAAPKGIDYADLQKAVSDAENAVVAANDALSSEDGFDHTTEGEELRTLKAFAEEAEDYADDWKYGVTLIRDSYFRDYAEELADDLGVVPKDVAWPMTCIDWRRAAEELKGDYTAIEFDGVTYWVR